MNKYVIITDTSSDLSTALRAEYDIQYLPMHYIVDGVDYEGDLDWKERSPKEFYDLMRNGKRITTAQVNAAQYTEAFDKILSEGYDILSVSCSSGLSASVKASYVAREEMLKKYPNAKIYCIDTLRACSGLGILCLTAAQMRNEGKSIEEVAAWLEENKLTVHQEGTVESLVYLKNAGRVSAASAFFGGLLNIKPIIMADAKGANFAVEKKKGRREAIKRIAERFAEGYVSCPHQKIFVSHADSIETANELKEAVYAVLPDKDIEIQTSIIGPGVGAATGPGMISVYFYGTKVETNA